MTNIAKLGVMILSWSVLSSTHIVPVRIHMGFKQSIEVEKIDLFLGFIQRILETSLGLILRIALQVLFWSIVDIIDLITTVIVSNDVLHARHLSDSSSLLSNSASLPPLLIHVWIKS